MFGWDLKNEVSYLTVGVTLLRILTAQWLSAPSVGIKLHSFTACGHVTIWIWKNMDRDNEQYMYKIIINSFLIGLLQNHMTHFSPTKVKNSILLNNMDMSFSKLGDMMNRLRFCWLPYDSDGFVAYLTIVAILLLTLR